mmetsp:Transcript_8274/g.15486  ORF Transcript_8274/g.15486 Transcript_8274/m.15486 type:complete len:89 (+) Transcript_8274:489-755(+)
MMYPGSHAHAAVHAGARGCRGRTAAAAAAVAELGSCLPPSLQATPKHRTLLLIRFATVALDAAATIPIRLQAAIATNAGALAATSDCT